MDRAIIVGAGGAGQELLAELRKDAFWCRQCELIGFVDDDPAKKGITILGVTVLGAIDDVPAILRRHEINLVMIAIPSSDGKTIHRIINRCQGIPVRVQVVPRLSEIIHGVIDVAQVREIEVEDLLGRSVVRQDFSAARERVEGKVVMVLGAAGSIGSELCSQILSLAPRQLVCVDWWENGMFDLQTRLAGITVDSSSENLADPEFVLASIRDRNLIDRIVATYQPNVVFNAAAYKHVPLMERNPAEAVLNNIMGTRNLFDAAVTHGVEHLVLISTDKAVNPTNVMGASKRVTEKLMHCYSQSQRGTVFSAVRFGNVLNSNGSVIPTFRRQIRQGLVTVTHPEITRYFMTVQEAAQLVLQCWLMSTGDQIFLLDMGEPVKIVDLARLMIRLSGKEPDRDVRIEFTGLRPGEKLYEEPLTRVEQTTATLNNRVYIVTRDEPFDVVAFLSGVNDLIARCSAGNASPAEIKQRLKLLVPTYHETVSSGESCT